MPTPSTTTWRRGDVVLVPVGFTDASGAKQRPAVVISSDRYNAVSPDVMIASITGNLGAIRHPGDHVLVAWREAGLLRPSLAQAKIATVEAALIRRRLGTLAPTIWRPSTGGCAKRSTWREAVVPVLQPCGVVRRAVPMTPGKGPAVHPGAPGG